MREDISLEEITLQGIISSCENILDDLDNDANIEEKDMQDLVYADNVISEIQQRVGKKLTPSNINSTQIDNKNPFDHLRGN
jgi:H2-forming N5,N10-methylenetetrahydromethanopterin dehydrogenase-like enzyme